jgi:hypothetical protein
MASRRFRVRAGPACPGASARRLVRTELRRGLAASVAARFAASVAAGLATTVAAGFAATLAAELAATVAAGLAGSMAARTPVRSVWRSTVRRRRLVLGRPIMGRPGLREWRRTDNPGRRVGGLVKTTALLWPDPAACAGGGTRSVGLPRNPSQTPAVELGSVPGLVAVLVIRPGVVRDGATGRRWRAGASRAGSERCSAAGAGTDANVRAGAARDGGGRTRCARQRCQPAERRGAAGSRRAGYGSQPRGSEPAKRDGARGAPWAMTRGRRADLAPPIAVQFAHPIRRNR